MIAVTLERIHHRFVKLLVLLSFVSRLLERGIEPSFNLNRPSESCS